MEYSNFTKLKAFLVHVYTGAGGIIGMWALVAVFNQDLNKAFLLFMITMIIDSTDGTLARRLNIKEVLPQYNGATLDNVVDMLTFAWIPLLIIYSLNVLPDNIWLIVPAIAAMYAYTQENMKTEDGFFLGFPTYWNVVALYLYLFKPGEEISLGIILLFSLLSFVPTRYLYPSKNYYMWKVTWTLGAIWFGVTTYILAQDEINRNLSYISLFYPLYYLVMSFYVEFRYRFTKDFRKDKAKLALAE